MKKIGEIMKKNRRNYNEKQEKLRVQRKREKSLKKKGGRKYEETKNWRNYRE